LSQLNSLTIRLHDGEHYIWHGLPWIDDLLRTLGSSRLPLLHMLRLEGDDEHCGYPSEEVEDPNFDWDGVRQRAGLEEEFEEDEKWDPDDGPRRATHAQVTVEGGMRHMLQLPFLTRLAAPFIPPEALNSLRSLAAAAGRHSLHIKRIVPLGRRSDFEKRWIDGR
jgi:hypothetical protein